MRNLRIRWTVLFLSLGATLLAQLNTGLRSKKQQHEHSEELFNQGAATSLPDSHPERGDVPGWVMITLMSAVLVAALLALAGPALEAMFNQAMDKVGS